MRGRLRWAPSGPPITSRHSTNIVIPVAHPTKMTHNGLSRWRNIAKPRCHTEAARVKFSPLRAPPRSPWGRLLPRLREVVCGRQFSVWVISTEWVVEGGLRLWLEDRVLSHSGVTRHAATFSVRVVVASPGGLQRRATSGISLQRRNLILARPPSPPPPPSMGHRRRKSEGTKLRRPQPPNPFRMYYLA